MDEQQKSIGDRLRELFSDRKTDVITTYGAGDATLTHHLREATAEEDIAFRRRSTAVKFIGSRAVPADEAFQAPILFYDQICESVDVEIDGESQILDDFKNKIPPDLKCAVISAFQNRFQIVINRNGEGKN